jgi:hypothetical protein
MVCKLLFSNRDSHLCRVLPFPSTPPRSAGVSYVFRAVREKPRTKHGSQAHPNAGLACRRNLRPRLLRLLTFGLRRPRSKTAPSFSVRPAPRPVRRGMAATVVARFRPDRPKRARHRASRPGNRSENRRCRTGASTSPHHAATCSVAARLAARVASPAPADGPIRRPSWRSPPSDRTARDWPHGPADIAVPRCRRLDSRTIRLVVRSAGLLDRTDLGLGRLLSGRRAGETCCQKAGQHRRRSPPH